MQNPLVALIVPIYNVKDYLRECLDSLINQSYENLQIILIDDASTDTSLEIAKEYLQKDPRITLLVHQKNEGMGASRNLGWDYVLHQDLKTISADPLRCGGGDKHSFIPSYIHFVDSDDYLSKDCIKHCVELALEFDAEIVWHNHRFYIQQTQTSQQSSFLTHLKLKEKHPYKGIDIFRSLPKPMSFSWSTMGLINLEFLKKQGISFQNGIESEDALFGMQLFSLSQRIILSHQEEYIYRIRPHSISAFTLTKESKEMNFPSSLNDLMQAFKTPYEVRHYNFAYSHCVICLKLEEFIQTHSLDDELKEILLEMLRYRAIYAFGALSFAKDPRDCRAMCKKLLPYASKIRFASKIAYYFPRLFRLLKGWEKIKRNSP